MSLTNALGTVFAILLATGCAKGSMATGTSGPPADSAVGPPPIDGCGDLCDSDGDGVPDGIDKCAGTPMGDPVNLLGCADSQLMPMLEPTFPPYGLTWTPTGDLGRAGGLTWNYTGIARADLFHIWWFVCDDPTTVCGLSLDGPIDQSFEKWQIALSQSDLPNGKLVFINSTHITLADGTSPALSGRLTVTIADAAAAAIPFATAVTLGVTARNAGFGAEIKGTGFQVTAITEVQDPMTLAYTPTTDYYDTAATPDTGDAGGNSYLSFDGAFYDK